MVQKEILKNKIRLVTHSMKERGSVSVGLWIGTGGRFENDRNKGAAHYLEHMLFKGSQKYSCAQIKEKIEGIGGSLNAFTDQEMTCYYAKVPSKFTSSTFDVLGDMVSNPLLTRKNTDKERGVILEEIKMYHDLPQYFVMELLDELMWPNHPLGKNLAGTMESIRGMSCEDLRSFHRKYYSPENIVVAAAGDLDYAGFASLVHKKMFRKRAKSKINPYPAKNSQKMTKVKFVKKPIEQMHLVLGAFGISQSDPRRRTLSLLSVLLGGNMSSRLFNEVREKRGLAYAISSGCKFYRDTGLFLIRAGIDNRKIVKAAEIILKELEKIQQHPPSVRELKRSKDYYIGQILLGLEDTMERMLWMGQSALSLNRVDEFTKVAAEINAIKAFDIQMLAREVFRKGNFNISIVGPLKESQDKELRKILGIK